MRIVKPPEKVNRKQKEKTLFLSGVIDMGKARDWQTELSDKLSDVENLIVLNPRRDDWDSSWKQSIDNPQFNEQVTWELEGIEKADAIVVYVDKDSSAPITLLELGIVAKTSKYVLAHCPEGFYRKGNVDIVCKRYGIEQVENLDEMAKKLRYYFS